MDTCEVFYDDWRTANEYMGREKRAQELLHRMEYPEEREEIKELVQSDPKKFPELTIYVMKILASKQNENK